MVTNILAMETKPGTLLKVDPNATAQKFLSSAQQCDVEGTCGMLASLIVLNKGVEHTPLSLLGNHMTTALHTINAQDTASQAPGTIKLEKWCAKVPDLTLCLIM